MNEIRKGNGYLKYREGSGGTVEIFDIAVTDRRRRGTGREMVQELMAQQPEGTLVFAVTRHDNVLAQHFYEGIRFRVVGVLRGFYKTDINARDSVDAIMYGKNVGDLS